MNDSLYLITGISTASIGILICLYFGGFKLIGIIAFLSFFGWLGICVYEIKANSWLGFMLVKVPLNVFFNLFLLLLLLKSWTMLRYKAQLDALDKKLIENYLT